MDASPPCLSAIDKLEGGAAKRPIVRFQRHTTEEQGHLASSRARPRCGRVLAFNVTLDQLSRTRCIFLAAWGDLKCFNMQFVLYAPTYMRATSMGYRSRLKIRNTHPGTQNKTNLTRGRMSRVLFVYQCPPPRLPPSRPPPPFITTTTNTTTAHHRHLAPPPPFLTTHLTSPVSRTETPDPQFTSQVASLGSVRAIPSGVQTSGVTQHWLYPAPFGSDSECPTQVM